MTINNINTTNISTIGNLQHSIIGFDSSVAYIHFSCDEHIYDLINAYTMYNEFNKAGFEVQLKYVTKNIEKIILGISSRIISYYNMLEIYHIIKDFNNEKLLKLFTKNIIISHLEGIGINSITVEDYLEDSKKEFNKIIKIRLIKNEI